MVLLTAIKLHGLFSNRMCTFKHCTVITCKQTPRLCSMEQTTVSLLAIVKLRNCSLQSNSRVGHVRLIALPLSAPHGVRLTEVGLGATATQHNRQTAVGSNVATLTQTNQDAFVITWDKYTNSSKFKV